MLALADLVRIVLVTGANMHTSLAPDLRFAVPHHCIASYRPLSLVALGVSTHFLVLPCHTVLATSALLVSPSVSRHPHGYDVYVPQVIPMATVIKTTNPLDI